MVRTILEVDDDPNDVFLLQHALRKAGVANPIQVASDGQQAINYLQGAGKFADRAKFPFPCLVLMDLKLPLVMGLEVLRWIRQQPWMPLPVIMLTASGSEADIAEAYHLGANAFLTKPSEACKLEEMVRAIKDFWLTHNTLPQGTAPELDLGRVMWRVAATTTGSATEPRPRVNGVPRSKRRHQPKGSS